MFLKTAIQYAYDKAKLPEEHQDDKLNQGYFTVNPVIR